MKKAKSRRAKTPAINFSQLFKPEAEEIDPLSLTDQQGIDWLTRYGHCFRLSLGRPDSPGWLTIELVQADNQTFMFAISPYNNYNFKVMKLEKGLKRWEGEIGTDTQIFLLETEQQPEECEFKITFRMATPKKQIPPLPPLPELPELPENA